ncbi:GSCOCG00012472001-RA-CDS [Cotesia congregata]|nr:GSCOCG00012472001-RA-CDS [Cotesia congregata]
MIKEIYKLTSAEVVVNGKVSRKFDTNVGVRQGCALSAILFDIFLDDIDEEWSKKEEGGTVFGKTKVRALKYADDIAIIVESAPELQKMLRSLQIFTERNKLKVNTKKTKVMVFRNGGKGSKDEKWTFKGENIEVVNQFKYLGYTFTSKHSTRRHVEEMVGKSQKAANAAWGEG